MLCDPLVEAGHVLCDRLQPLEKVLDILEVAASVLRVHQQQFLPDPGHRLVCVTLQKGGHGYWVIEGSRDRLIYSRSRKAMDLRYFSPDMRN